ncbi:hypothetical protein CES86_5526 [Brucella lupini]|uniref:Uncharacterized protein n=1 Tax=Brucella lupini TaxID=255457 RepID=A0A256H022_9HYPH|nr:hypothetical protein CES86_5526 [Brucella lupini]
MLRKSARRQLEGWRETAKRYRGNRVGDLPFQHEASFAGVGP